MEKISLLQEGLEKVDVLGLVDLRGLGQLPGVQHRIEIRQRLGISQHVVDIRLPVHHILVKQDRYTASAHVTIGQIHRGFTGDLIGMFHDCTSDFRPSADWYKILYHAIPAVFNRGKGTIPSFRVPFSCSIAQESRFFLLLPLRNGRRIDIITY